MIDLHCHVLPGIDDGPSTIDASVALARAAAAAGTRTIVATSHVNWHYQNDSATIARLVDELDRRLGEEGVPVAIRPGAEIALTRIAEIEPAEIERLGLAGGPWLLVEPPFTPVATHLDTILLGLQHSGGHRVVLAHPERCAALRRKPEMLRSLVRAGVLTSVTAGSFAGRFGAEARAFALELARTDLLHNVASDAHDVDRRPPEIVNALRDAGLEALTEWLTEDVPAAILDGAERIPPRPPVTIARPTAWGRLRRRSLRG